MKPTFIYLIEKYNIPVYIGASINVKNRFSCHKSTTFKNNTDGLSYKILEECTSENASKQEIYWIDYYNKKETTLLNKSIGGYSSANIKNNSTIIIKLSSEIVDKVRKQKEISGIPIGKFFELAAEKELVKSTKKK